MTAAGAFKKTNPPEGSIGLSRPRLTAAFLWTLSLIVFWQPLRALLSLAIHDERSTHILIIPIITAGLVYLRRRRIFQETRFCPWIGASLLVISTACWYVFRSQFALLETVDQLSGAALLVFLTWIGIFVFCFGITTLRLAAFPLSFLLLMVPLPAVVSQGAVSVLQAGSAETSYTLFRLIGLPAVRNGFQFSLPGVDIEVAKECSGIRSALSLFIVSMLVGHLFLQVWWKRAILTLCSLPIAIFKNAVRIVTISWLGVRVSPSYFDNPLHHQGGLPFSLLALALLLLLVRLLKLSRAQGKLQVGIPK